MAVEPPTERANVRFPSLNALRAFEAAARLGSFAQAAVELSVTPGAISQQIKTLENWANITLFERQAQRVVLTDTGKALQPMLQDAFDALTAAVHYLDDLNGQPTLHIAAMPSVAQLWVSPRLEMLRQAFPEYTVSVSAMEQSPDLQRTLYDASVFIAPATASETQIILAGDEIFPVCTPALAEHIERDGLNNVTRLHDAVWHEDWRHWSQATGHRLTDPDSGAQYSLYSIALEQCKAGQGVLIGHQSLVEQSLADGTLVRPFAESVHTDFRLVLTLSKRLIERPFGQRLVEVLSES